MSDICNVYRAVLQCNKKKETLARASRFLETLFHLYVHMCLNVETFDNYGLHNYSFLNSYIPKENIFRNVK